jgi:8-oxo-dGTP pyrophosphatase MutT (NUDIX family)
MERLFAALEPLAISARRPTSSRQAAVLLPLWQDPLGWWLTLTRRAAHLKHHPGQVSLPGGVLEPDDESLAAAALRETHEEIGLQPEHFQLKGRLPPIQTTSDFEVHPFVAVYRGRPTTVHCTDEVMEVFHVPLSWVLDKARWQKEVWLQDNHCLPYWAAWFEDRLVWGATAVILRELAHRWSRTLD